MDFRKIAVRVVHNLQESLDSPIDRRSDYYRQRARGNILEKTGKFHKQPMLTLPNLCEEGVELWACSADIVPLPGLACVQLLLYYVRRHLFSHTHGANFRPALV